MSNVIDITGHLKKKADAEVEFKARHWNMVYTDALGMGMDMSQAMDVADSVMDEMWKAGISAEEGNLTVEFQEE